MSGLYRLQHWLWGGLDWLFPPVCGCCNRTGFRWCPDCHRQVIRVPEPVCPCCGLPPSHPGLCPSCLESQPPYKAIRSWVVFEGPFRHAIHTMKYGRNASIAETLAVHLALYARELGCQVDLAVPVPLGKQRTNERGYNQVGLLARPLAGIPDWRYSPQALVRTREIRSQVGFFPLEHKKNISGAFRAGPTLAAGKDMLLVDDIVTTGATLAPCSDALVKAGERNIYALTPARHYRTTDLKLFDKIQTSQGANYDS